ncbi:AraC family transcriptional regulator [Microbulbifer pacificus]|uniref:AraC family transcriptional regulator n=1 Tax=Microbulbifer pacificus TaxID=407164 RepID=A0AAU0N2V6_9GAMM|nr:AraC family transcriptional regulator [Microbulbifer pacificus]WOX06813.1 AraC family transcriptional regulator [Microbulbifer pacificus]
MSDDFIALSGWVIPITKAMQLNNIDVQQALEVSGITDADLNSQDTRIAVSKLVKLVAHCNAHLPKQDFSVQVAEQFHPGMFHALGYAMMSSASLEDGLQRIVRYKRIVSDACRVEMVEEKDGLSLRMYPLHYADNARPTLGPKEIEAFLATLVKFARETVDMNLRPLAVYLQADRPDNDYLTEYFGVEPQFNCDFNALVFDRAQAQRKLMTHNMVLTQSHEKMLDEYLSRIDRSDLANLVKCKIYERLSLGAPSQAEIADDLGMSLRNLQRKLQERGTSFKEILEHTRKKLALEYMDQSHLSLGEIGYLVGFASVANFNRAFKRWTGSTPGEFRVSHAA